MSLNGWGVSALPEAGGLRARRALDFAMFALVLASFAYRLIESTAHEVVGFALLALSVLHGLLNRRWFQTLARARYTGPRRLMTAVNALLLAAALTLFASGLLSSRLLGIRADLVPHWLHPAAAWWFLILMSVHLGLHGRLILGQLRIAAPTGRALVRIAAFGLAAYGVPASFERSVLSRLCAQYSFDEWDFDVWSLIQVLAIVGLYATIAHGAQSALRRLPGRESR